jgi:hypothetical protein
LVSGGACALNTGLHSGEEAGALLAMALEVGEGRAAVAGEGSDEAGQLLQVSGGVRRLISDERTAQDGMLSS